jgi:hypothetical protein
VGGNGRRDEGPEKISGGRRHDEKKPEQNEEENPEQAEPHEVNPPGAGSFRRDVGEGMG